MKIVAIADTHGKHDSLNLPTGDVLIHAGDFTNGGHKEEAYDFFKWFGDQDFDHRIVVAGNHERCLSRGQRDRPTVKRYSKEASVYLEDESVEIDGVKFYGSPWTPQFNDWAFMKEDYQLKHYHWSEIPGDTNILITHGPPAGVLDETANGKNVGSETLNEDLERVQPHCHIFGHIHESYGRTKINEVEFINCSSVDQNFDLVNEPVVLEIDPTLIAL